MHSAWNIYAIVKNWIEPKQNQSHSENDNKNEKGKK